MRVGSSFFAVILVVGACQLSPTASRGERVVGEIDQRQRVITAPSEVAVGESFDVTVSTIGNSCVSAAGADVAINGLTATITPYDFRRDDTGCLDYAAPYPRTVRLRFDQLGTATIRVTGRSYNEPVTVEHTLVVGPRGIPQ